MSVVMQGKRRSTTYAVPPSAAIMWYGLAADIPSGFYLDTYYANMFVQGCAASLATDTPAGSNSHTHTNPSATGSQASHSHTVGGGDTTAASGSDTVSDIQNNTYSAPAGHTHEISSGSSSSAGIHSHTLSAAALADAYPPYAQLYWIRATAESAAPVGSIIMWDNPIASPPTGFVLCDGTGGTIDLRDRFIYGAANDGELGDTGGAETHTHANADSGEAGTHSHTIGLTALATESDKNLSGYTGVAVSAGGHTHALNTTTSTEADHTHTLGSTGSGSSLPPYVKLYFLQRTS